jgi:hypothetical protein
VNEDTKFWTVDELRERRDEARHELTALEVRSRGKKFDEDERELYANLVEEIKDLGETLEERVKRENLLLRLAHSDAAVPAFDPGPHWRDRDSVDPGSAPFVAADRAMALRTIERHQDILRPEAGDRLDRLIRQEDPSGILSRYLVAVGSEDYARGFAKMLMHPQDAHFRMTEREAAALLHWPPASASGRLAR